MKALEDSFSKLICFLDAFEMTSYSLETYQEFSKESSCL